MNSYYSIRRYCTVALGSASLLAALTCSATLPNYDLHLVGSYSSGIYNAGGSEIVAHDPLTQRLFVVNALEASVDILDIQNPANPIKIGSKDLSLLGGVANSVAVKDGIVAVALENFIKTDPGMALFFDANMEILAGVQVGSLPDMITFSPNGKYVLTANEGEPNTYNNVTAPSVDPSGSVSIINLAGGVGNLTQANVRTIDFSQFNAATLDPSIRIYGPNATVAQDLEPEYIAISQDSKTAFVTMQENNALATINLKTGTITSLKGLGFKDHSLPGNELDPSDRDSASGTGAIKIGNWPIKGMYQPDTIAAYTVHGETFLLMANEGDARDWPGFAEEIRAGAAGYVLDPTKFPDAGTLKSNANLGRLQVTKSTGDTDNDGDYDEIYSFGARSFTIRRPDGSIVWDSGADFELITAAAYPTRFNISNTANGFDGRSPNKGPEPEGLAVGNAYGRTYAFIGLERIGGVMVYDITDPYSPFFVTYRNNRNVDVAPSAATLAAAGDLGPEGVLFIRRENSPNGYPLVVVGNEISGTTTIYQFSR